jgi:ferredoxin
LLNGNIFVIMVLNKIIILREDFEMAYIINDACISCGACEAECPVECISAGDDKYVIAADTCIECGACAGVCPVDAPQPE